MNAAICAGLEAPLYCTGYDDAASLPEVHTTVYPLSIRSIVRSAGEYGISRIHNAGAY